MIEPRFLDVPVVADNWREARKKALRRVREFTMFRDRRIVRTHTQPSVVWAVDFKTWDVTIEFERMEA